MRPYEHTARLRTPMLYEVLHGLHGKKLFKDATRTVTEVLRLGESILDVAQTVPQNRLLFH